MNRETLVNNDKSSCNQRGHIDVSVPLEPHIIHAPAALANEMVVLFERRVVACVAFAKAHSTDLSFFGEPLQITIDRAKAHSG